MFLLKRNFGVLVFCLILFTRVATSGFETTVNKIYFLEMKLFNWENLTMKVKVIAMLSVALLF